MAFTQALAISKDICELGTMSINLGNSSRSDMVHNV
jgi:hypothetical protein